MLSPFVAIPMDSDTDLPAMGAALADSGLARRLRGVRYARAEAVLAKHAVLRERLQAS